MSINQVRKTLIKKEYLKTGGNGYKALRAGGLAESTARHRVRANNKLLNVVKMEIERDITKEITIKSVLEGLKRIEELAIQDKDFSTATRCKELQGKWLQMFSERVEVTVIDQPDNQFSLERLSRINQAIPHQAVGKDG